MENLRLAQGLTPIELQSIKELENICCQAEPLHMKLNWDMLENRAVSELNDFLYYDGDKLIGFIGIYSFGAGAKEIELTGMVHPDYRRKGVATKLYAAAKQECEARRADKILLITERSSDSGIGFARSVDSTYSFSEYRMKFEGTQVPPIQRQGLVLRKITAQDFSAIVQVDVICFGTTSDEAALRYINENLETIYLIEKEGKDIGKIGMIKEGKDGYIFGFGILPECRRRGYGREALSLALEKLLTEKVQSVLLEVAVKNDRALQLYKSCGFKELTIYDYYEIVLESKGQT